MGSEIRIACHHPCWCDTSQCFEGPPHSKYTFVLRESFRQLLPSMTAGNALLYSLQPTERNGQLGPTVPADLERGSDVNRMSGSSDSLAVANPIHNISLQCKHSQSSMHGVRDFTQHVNEEASGYPPSTRHHRPVAMPIGSLLGTNCPHESFPL